MENIENQEIIKSLLNPISKCVCWEIFEDFMIRRFCRYFTDQHNDFTYFYIQLLDNSKTNNLFVALFSLVLYFMNKSCVED